MSPLKLCFFALSNLPTPPRVIFSIEAGQNKNKKQLRTTVRCKVKRKHQQSFVQFSVFVTEGRFELLILQISSFSYPQAKTAPKGKVE